LIQLRTQQLLQQQVLQLETLAAKVAANAVKAVVTIANARSLLTPSA
jgi:hypothetical protein